MQDSLLRRIAVDVLTDTSHIVLRLSLLGIIVALFAGCITVAEAAGQVQLEILSVNNIRSDPLRSRCCAGASGGGQTPQLSASAQDSTALAVAVERSVPTVSPHHNSSHDAASCSGICRAYLRVCFKQDQKSKLSAECWICGQYQRSPTLSQDEDCGSSPAFPLPYTSPSNAHLGSLASGTPSSPVTFPNNNSFVAIDLPFDFAWKKNYTLLIELMDAQDESPDLSLEQALQSEEIGRKNNWRIFTYVGKKTEIRCRIRIVCDEFYGYEECQTFCKPRDDFFGHWLCSADAKKVCMDGWTGFNCDTAICAPGCQNKPNGMCLVPGECRCRSGWKGENCDQWHPLVRRCNLLFCPV